MKLPITDQFLRELLEVTSDTAHLVFKRRTLISVLSGSENPFFEKYRKLKNRQKFNKLIYYLKKNNFIKVENLKGNNAISLTKEGEDKAMRARFKIGDNQQKRRSDGKWIMIIFDIPQMHKKQRSLLRSVLVNLGYKMFQQSVWITSNDVFKSTEKSLQYYSLDRYVRIFLVNEL